MVHKQLPFIGASPDREVVVTFPNWQQMKFYLQIKCPIRPAAQFPALPQSTALQVATELAVIRTHDPEVGFAMFTVFLNLQSPSSPMRGDTPPVCIA